MHSVILQNLINTQYLINTVLHKEVNYEAKKSDKNVPDVINVGSKVAYSMDFGFTCCLTFYSILL